MGEWRTNMSLEFAEAVKELKDHKEDNKNHRITNSKMAASRKI